MKIIFYYHANKTHFHKKGFALGLVLRVRVFVTRKRPITNMILHTHIADLKYIENNIKYIENNTWTRGDLKFIFECSTRYLTSERSERVRYRD